MKEYYERINDTWHSISYRKAITTLRGVNRRICFASEAIELPNIGERIAAKIEEVVRTDQVQPSIP